MPAIVGFEIKADNIENVFKLSQNRDEKSYLNIISKLEEQGGNSVLIASEMEKEKENCFLREWPGTNQNSTPEKNQKNNFAKPFS